MSDDLKPDGARDPIRTQFGELTTCRPGKATPAARVTRKRLISYLAVKTRHFQFSLRRLAIQPQFSSS
jgi:hypothetical protein